MFWFHLRNYIDKLKVPVALFWRYIFVRKISYKNPGLEACFGSSVSNFQGVFENRSQKVGACFGILVSLAKLH